MNQEEFVRLLLLADEIVCAKCGEPVAISGDLFTDEEPAGIMCNGLPFCLDCFEEIAHRPHPLTMKRPEDGGFRR